jgi:hypothetical protein
MTTEWTTPTLFSQYAEESAEDIHVPWDASKFNALQNIDNHRLGLNGVLTHIARSPKTDTTNKTYYLKAQGFNFNNLPNVISGIELRIKSERRGRVTDDTIQLLIDDSPISVNKANLNVDPIKTYGGSTDRWNIEDIHVENLRQSTFGVLVRFQSHPHYPHKDGAYISGIELRIY